MGYCSNCRNVRFVPEGPARVPSICIKIFPPIESSNRGVEIEETQAESNGRQTPVLKRIVESTH
jgi:hypothetical protein